MLRRDLKRKYRAELDNESENSSDYETTDDSDTEVSLPCGFVIVYQVKEISS